MEIIGECVLNEAQIARNVALVAEQLNCAFAGKTVVVLSVVPGGIFFSADLLRQCRFDLSLDYIACAHRPGARVNHSPVIYSNNIDINGKTVLLVDDAVESGATMQQIIGYLSRHFSPVSVSVAVLLVKPGRLSLNLPLYYAVETENNDLLAGYGMPWQERYRHLPFIAKVRDKNHALH